MEDSSAGSKQHQAGTGCLCWAHSGCLWPSCPAMLTACEDWVNHEVHLAARANGLLLPAVLKLGFICLWNDFIDTSESSLYFYIRMRSAAGKLQMPANFTKRQHVCGGAHATLITSGGYFVYRSLWTFLLVKKCMKYIQGNKPSHTRCGNDAFAGIF